MPPFVAASGADARPGVRASRARKVRELIPKPEASPYFEVDQADWTERTRELIDQHPLSTADLVETSLESWDQIFESQIGPFRIGLDIFPSPQALGSLLHELVPANLARRFPENWRREQSSSEKDIVCLADDRFSTEIKTSSSTGQVFGNRSFGQEDEGRAKKAKSGYYLAINFGKYPPEREVGKVYKPGIRQIRFGWLDHVDWTAQTKETGQQANLAPVIEDSQLLVIYALE